MRSDGRRFDELSTHLQRRTQCCWQYTISKECDSAAAVATATTSVALATAVAAATVAAVATAVASVAAATPTPHVEPPPRRGATW